MWMSSWSFGHLIQCDLYLVTSVLSHQNIWINGFQFSAGIVDDHLPVHAPLTPIDIGGPGSDFAAKSLQVAETAAGEALTGHGAQFTFRDVQPTPVPGRVTEHDAANQRPGPLWLEPLVESPFGVRVEVVAHHHDPGARRVPRIAHPLPRRRMHPSNSHFNNFMQYHTFLVTHSSGLSITLCRI